MDLKYIKKVLVKCHNYKKKTKKNTISKTIHGKTHRNLSCPAVSQSCNFIRLFPLISIKRAKKSTPTVGSDT